jgi:Lon protease-like protein
MLQPSSWAPPATAEELADVPLFPLPRIVFFPHTQLPLHFFEPRYRAMIEDVTKRESGLLVVAQLAPGWEADYEGQPDVRRVAGLGRIIAHEARPDGTHDVLLQGLARVRVSELPLASRGYRRVRATVLEDRGAERLGHEELMAVHACASAIASSIRRRHPSFELDVTPEMGAARMLDLVADRLIAAPEARQAILETLDLPARGSALLDALEPLLAHLGEDRGAPS